MRIYFYSSVSWILGLDAFGPLERALEKKLWKIEGLEGARVKIEGTRWGLMVQGWIKSLTVEMEGLRLGGLRTKLFTIRAERQRIHPFLMFCRNRLKVREAGEAEWLLRIVDEDLDAFFASKGALWRYVRTMIADGRIQLRMESAVASMFGVTPVSVLGALKLREDGHIDLELEDLRAFGINPGRALVSRFLEMVNPVIRTGAINRMLREHAPDMFEPFVLHNTIKGIELDAGEALVCGEIITFRREKKEQKDEG
jgi:hypothetical protein